MKMKTERFVMKVVDEFPEQGPSLDSIDDIETIARLMREVDEDTILAEIWMAAYEKARDEWMARRAARDKGASPEGLLPLLLPVLPVRSGTD